MNAYLNLGRACEILSEHRDASALDRAIPALRRLLAHAPDAGEARRQFRANLQHMAHGYESRAQLVEAQRAWEFLAESDPRAIEPLMSLARIAQQRHDFKSALSYLAHARALQPDYAPAHFFFGIVCIELDLPVEAKKALQKAIDLDPNNAMYNYARGSVELQGKSAWLATPYFKKFVAAQPDNPRGHFALGAALFASQDYTAAAGEMKLVAGNRETAAGAQYFLGRIAKVEGDWNAAADHLAKSIAATPDYSDSHAELGLARMHTGDLTGAQVELDRALQLNPDSYLANANLLTLYQRTKDPRFDAQQRRLRELDSKRSEKQELMLRTIRVEP